MLTWGHSLGMRTFDRKKSKSGSRFTFRFFLPCVDARKKNRFLNRDPLFDFFLVGTHLLFRTMLMFRSYTAALPSPVYNDPLPSVYYSPPLCACPSVQNSLAKCLSSLYHSCTIMSTAPALSPTPMGTIKLQGQGLAVVKMALGLNYLAW